MPRCIPRSMQGGIASSALPDPLDAAGYSRGVTGDAAPSWWQRLGGPNAVSMPAWLLTAPFAVVAFLESAARIAVGPSPVPQWWVLLVVSVGGQVVLGLVCWLSWLTILRPDGRPSRPGVALLTFLVAGLARSIWTDATASGLFGFTFPRAELRLVVATGISVILLVLATLIVDGYRRHRETRRRLEDQLAQAEQFEEQSRQALEGYRRELVADVEATVRREVGAIATAAQGGGDVSAQLTAVTRQVLQPLAVSLRGQRSEVLVLPTVSPSRGRVLLETVRGVFTGSPFVPGASAALTVAILGSNVLSVYGSGAGLLTLAVFLAITWGGLSLASRYVGPHLTHLRLPVAALVVMTVWVAIAAAGLAVTFSLLSDEALGSLQILTSGALALRALSFSLICIAGPAVAKGVVLQWREAERRLQEAIADVSQAAAALQLEAWSERRKLGTRVHGQVQAEIVSTALRISTDLDADAEELLASLDARIPVILSEGRTSEWRPTLADLRTVWELSIDLTVAVASDAAMMLDAHPASAHAVMEVVREGITNAVRAGGADVVNADVSLTPTGIRVRVEDDGDGLVGQGPPGAGSRLLDEICLGWSRESTDGGTTLVAVVALPSTHSGTDGGTTLQPTGVNA